VRSAKNAVVTFVQRLWFVRQPPREGGLPRVDRRGSPRAKGRSPRAHTRPGSPPNAQHRVTSAPSVAASRATQKPCPPAWRCTSGRSPPGSIVTVRIGEGANTATRPAARCGRQAGWRHRRRIDLTVMTGSLAGALACDPGIRFAAAWPACNRCASRAAAPQGRADRGAGLATSCVQTSRLRRARLQDRVRLPPACRNDHS
jgi:hypothetical protein